MPVILGDLDVASDDVGVQAVGGDTLAVSVAVPTAAEREVRRHLTRAGRDTDSGLDEQWRGEPAMGARSRGGPLSRGRLRWLTAGESHGPAPVAMWASAS
ncbi:hypothetical protein LUW75_03860 [Streptomyces sp. MRC013]|uniref:hypothetical protein n=1 Tax=Streptomyces sp. MRC013 TaxID=2898276 RepID=UPI002026F65E|nr:hypothetical protein [Streptomyces sp. MRC013]URM89287.1 hypothetical protein LUW75_03860 [Streptomyces sp. MRC013]